MPLANYTTQVSASKSASEIEVMLQARHARAIVKEFDQQDNLAAMSFIIPTKHGDLPFQLPANAGAVKRVLERQAVRAKIDDTRAQRVAWRILRDWVRAQMAIIETEMVSIEEVFLPYMVTANHQTLYQRMAAGGFKELPRGQP